MAEVLEETLTTKEETTTHGKRETERSTSGRVPQKQRSTRRKAAQAKEAAGAQADGVPKHCPNADRRPGNRGAARNRNRGAGKSGIELLTDAVNKTLAEDCQVLSKKLAERARNGHVSAVRLLVMLADRKKPREVPTKKPHGLTYAQRLSAEPQWEGDEPEQQAAKGGGDSELVNLGG